MPRTPQTSSAKPATRTVAVKVPTVVRSPWQDREPSRLRIRVKRLATAGAVVLTWVAVLGGLALLMLVAIGPRVFGYQIEAVLSGSMVPTFRPGDAVLVTREATADVRVGQVISYKIPVGDHHVETHRIVRVISGGHYPVVITKGDANTSPDPWRAKLQGAKVWRMRAVIPDLGTAIHDLRTPIAHVLTMLLAPIIIVVLLLVRIWRPRPDPIRPQWK
jgi:signal peptidase